MLVVGAKKIRGVDNQNVFKFFSTFLWSRFAFSNLVMITERPFLLLNTVTAEIRNLSSFKSGYLYLKSVKIVRNYCSKPYQILNNRFILSARMRVFKFLNMF